MKHKHQNSSLQARIIASCIAISVAAVMIVSMVLYNILSSVIREKVSTTTQSKLENISVTVDQHISSIFSFMDSFVSNSSVNAALVSKPWTYTNSEATLISTLLKTAILANSNIIDSIIVYTDEGKLYVGGNGNAIMVSEVRQRFTELESSGEINSWQLCLEPMPTRHWASNSQQDYVLSLYYILRDTSSLERIGIIYAAIIPERLMSVLDVQDEQREVMLVDENGTILYSADYASIGQTLQPSLSPILQNNQGSLLFDDENGREFAVYTSTSVNGWCLVEIISYSSLTAELGKYILSLIIILSAIFALIIFFSISSTRHLVRPLRRLRNSMEAVQQGNYDITLPVESEDEIGQLTKTYNLMLTRIKQLIRDIYASEQKKRQVELQVLQTQINPHFLYNTLNSIHWMAVVHGLNSISDMVNALVAILRYSLSHSSTFATLKEEVSMLEPYLFIQNVRFSNGISFSCSVPEEYESCQIPRLLLQPLVENAISHGLRPMGGKGHIHIEGTVQNNILQIDITDNGAGMPIDLEDFTAYESLRIQLPVSGSERSIGLKNTFERIQLYFGNTYGLFFKSVAEKGTTVRVTLPVSFEEEENHDPHTNC